MKTNTVAKNTETTHEGGPAKRISPYKQLKRTIMSCLLWERDYYEDGVAIADRIKDLAGKVTQEQLAELAIEARTKMNLRHVPLLLLTCMCKRGGSITGRTITTVISRADELAELVAIYWKDGKQPLSKQMKLGLAGAFKKFGEHALAKYNRDGAVKLRDVLFLCHAKPEDKAQQKLWKRLIDGELKTPDTWEVALSGGADKKEAFIRLLKEEKLGYLALLRNLRNMTETKVDSSLIKKAILARKGAEKILPFRYIAAARACPQMEPTIDEALSEAISGLPVLKGKTVVLVDVSGSMDQPLSAKSDMKRIDAAAALGAIIHAEDLAVVTFSDRLVRVPARRGMAGVDVIIKSQPHRGTNLGGALEALNREENYDRLIVITDEQAADRVGQPKGKFNYMINVGTSKNGVGYHGKWTHLDGFSEAVLTYIHEHEKED